MSDKLTTFYISIGSSSHIDKEDIERLTRELIGELSDLDGVVSIQPMQSEELPEGAKGFPIDFGTILVKLAELGGITGVVTILSSWLSRDKSRTLKLQIGEKSLELTGLSKAEQQDLVRWFQTQSALHLDR